MRREGTHTHHCSNRAAGCQSTYACSNKNLDSNYDGFPDPVCHVNPDDSQPCEDCETSRCSECGSVLNVEKHDADCPKQTAWAV